ncbi:MAG: acyltransferase family protein [Candidatus Lokiarchaeota archaeon]|nr:acyltransferase family protein [Candidatus Lokiarchaeota archaeon]
MIRTINQGIVSKKSTVMDWRIELARIPPVIIVVIIHMLLDSRWIGSHTSPFNIMLFVSMAVFFYASGFVHGLKKEFDSPETLNKSIYFKFVKKRFLRLYIGYYLALGTVLLSRIIAYYTINQPFPFEFTPLTIFLDLVSGWGFTLSGCGGVWPPGWFICAIFMISLIYPFLRIIHSINKIYLYLIIIITIIVRIWVAITLYNPAYFFPFAWIAEFSIGMLIGISSKSSGGPPKPTKKYQKRIITIAKRVWPMYICHIVPIVFISYLAPLWEFILIFTTIFPLTEAYYRIIEKIYGFLGKRGGL